MAQKVKVGLIGCGNISPAYLKAAKTFKFMEIAVCADVNMDAAKKRALEFGIKAVTVDDILADKSISIILNLTVPQAHTEVNLKALNAGKHVYSEKPLAITREDGWKVVDLAAKKGLLVGCAPDTFLGAGLQTCRKIIDDGEIGRPIAGTAFMMCHGPESWHPNPGFYYLKGGGPMFDMGPYYLTALVHLLGPVKKVSGSTKVTFKERIAGCKEHKGERLPVETPTHVAGTIDFHSGAVVTMVMSFDVWNHTNHCIEIHGELGSMQVDDPNGFGGSAKIYRPGMNAWQDRPFTHGYSSEMRSIGTADMAMAILNNRKNRCSGDLAYHVLDVMHAFHDSSDKEAHVYIDSTCERPKALPLGLTDGELDK